MNDSSLDFTDEQWLQWYRMTPQQRWAESCRLWELYTSLGGSLEPEPDPQSPFYADYKYEPPAAYSPKIRVIRPRSA